jgi:penicillin-binding protein 1A
VRIVTQQGVEIARRGDRYGAAVHLNELPPALPHAILATEDRRFYDHFGIDLFGIARAMVVNVRAGGIKQGGSTITQQAAKNLFLTPDRTFRRKLQEVLLALWLEAKFTKDQIFTIYLNRVYFGQGVYGIDAAARYYFGVPAQTLSVYHSAMVAGMLKGPNKYNPYANLELAKQRTEVVLNNMVAAGYLSEADRKAIKRPTTWWTSAHAQNKPMAHYFADWVFDQVGDYVTLDQDVTVIVTVDARLQREAEAAVRAMMKPNGPAEKRNVSEVALVTLASDGAVLAMVGGADYGQSKFNRAVQALRQPGSAFKPIVYLAGLEAGLKPNSVLTDEPITIDGWSPSNFKNEYLGNMTLGEALARSINTIAVKVSERAGRNNVQAMAQKLGITHSLIDAPSLALGVSEVSVLEMTAAYGVFATGGLGVWPYAISEIQDGKGRPIYVRTGGGPGRVIPAGYAGAMNSMLSDVIESENGTGKAARLGRPAAGKTGTSQDYRDAWFIGYTPQLITGVWMGNDNGAAMNGVTGGNLPAQLWHSFMAKATTGMTVVALPDAPLPSDAPAPDTANEEAVKSFFKNMIDTLFGN